MMLKGTDPATPKTLQILAIKWGKVFERMGGGDAKASKADRLATATAILGREVATFKELTMAEASKLRSVYEDWPF